MYLGSCSYGEPHLQVLVGGGQEAMQVTTTSLRQGKFETRFWHKVFEEEVGRVKGHFGPINTYVSLLTYFMRWLMTELIELPSIRLERATLLEEKTGSYGFITSRSPTSGQSHMEISRSKTEYTFCYSYNVATIVRF